MKENYGTLKSFRCFGMNDVYLINLLIKSSGCAGSLVRLSVDESVLRHRNFLSSLFHSVKRLFVLPTKWEPLDVDEQLHNIFNGFPSLMYVHNYLKFDDDGYLRLIDSQYFRRFKKLSLAMWSGYLTAINRDLRKSFGHLTDVRVATPIEKEEIGIAQFLGLFHKLQHINLTPFSTFDVPVAIHFAATLRALHIVSCSDIFEDLHKAAVVFPFLKDLSLSTVYPADAKYLQTLFPALKKLKCNAYECQYHDYYAYYFLIAVQDLDDLKITDLILVGGEYNDCDFDLIFDALYRLRELRVLRFVWNGERFPQREDELRMCFLDTIITFTDDYQFDWDDSSDTDKWDLL